MKIGRNAPCPCGSGKKYKKCCLARDEEKRLAGLDREPSRPRPDREPSRLRGAGSLAGSYEDIVNALPSGVSMHPYTIAKMTENPEMYRERDPELYAAAKRYLETSWTIATIAQMSTGEIAAQLSRYGVPFDQAEFRREAEGLHSAWDVSRAWQGRHAVTCRGPEEDFLGLAACELWKRLIPERPSMEMIDDWMQEGYTLSAEGRGKEACDRWWRTWQALRERLTPEMTTMDDTEAFIQGLQCVFNWSQDFEMGLQNMALGDPAYAVIGRRYCREVIEQFPAETASIQVNCRRSLAEFCFRLKEAEEGLRALHEAVRLWPESVWGYIGLAEAYGHLELLEDHPVELDLAKAREWLDRGQTQAKVGATERRAIEERREMLDEKQPVPGDRGGR